MITFLLVFGISLVIAMTPVAAAIVIERRPEQSLVRGLDDVAHGRVMRRDDLINKP